MFLNASERGVVDRLGVGAEADGAAAPKILFSVFSVFSGGKNPKRQRAEAVCVGSTDGRLPTGPLGTPTKHTDCATSINSSP